MTSIKNDEVYASFEKEILDYQLERENYKFDTFLKKIFAPNIYYFCTDFTEYYTTLLETNKTDIILIYDFFDKIINGSYIPFLKNYYSDIFLTPNLIDKNNSDDNTSKNTFETFCLYGLILLNNLFVLNDTMLYNFELFFSASSSSFEEVKKREKEIVNKIIKEKLISDYTEFQNEILINICEICNFLKNLSINPASFYNKVLCDVLILDENYKLNVVD
jgi:hypothetical protein